MNGFRSNAFTLILGLVGFAAVVGGTCIGVLVALPDSQNPATILTIVLGFFGVIATTLSSLVLGGRANEKLDRASEQLDVTERKVDRVLNGEMEAKIEAVLHRVLAERQPGLNEATS